MKIFFTGSISASEEVRTHYKQIRSVAEALGHDVIIDHIFSVTEQDLRSQAPEARLQFLHSVENWIHQCDFVIAETTRSSTSVGYEIALALRAGKPILILYSDGDPPSLFAYHKDDKVVAVSYTPPTLKNTIEDFVTFVKSKHDLRFTFFIPPKIASFLDEISRQKKLPKAVYVRNLIEKDMEERFNS